MLRLTLRLGCPGDPHAAFADLRGRVKAVLADDAGRRVELGEAHAFRLERAAGGELVIACDATLDEPAWAAHAAAAGVEGFTVMGEWDNETHGGD